MTPASVADLPSTETSAAIAPTNAARVRFGIVGFGLHGHKRLMPAFALAERCSVTAVSNRSLEKARDIAKQYSLPHAFDSADALSACPDVDAVLVTSADVAHLADVLAAIGHRKPVLLEKPMGMNAAECQQMVETAERAGVILGVAHAFRFHESVRILRDEVAAGKIGKPVFARSEFSYLASGHPRKWLTDPKIAAGGPIADIGVHCFDTLRMILADEVVEVTARGFSDAESGPVEAAAVITLRFRSGALGSVAVSTRATYRTPVEIVGNSGALLADNCLTSEREVRVELYQNLEFAEAQEVNNRLTYTLQADAFAEAMSGGTPFPISGRDGWQNQLILDAAYKSLRDGIAVPVAMVAR